AERSGISAVTNTLAWARSRVTSTSDTLTDGSPCSRTASCTRVPSSRRSCAETRSVRWKDLVGICWFLAGPGPVLLRGPCPPLRAAGGGPETAGRPRGPSRRRGRGQAAGPPAPRRSQRALDLDALEALDLVARLDVVVLLHANAALGAVAHFVHVLLEAAQRFQLALEDDRVVAQDADRLVPLDHTLHHHAAGDGAELGAAEDVADLGGTDDLLADLHAQQAGSNLLHLVDHVISDREGAQDDGVGPDDRAGS